MRLYLDFDGVINASGCASEWAHESVDVTEYGGFTLIWSEHLVRELIDAVDRGELELVWVTNWPSRDVEAVLRMMGFGRGSAEFDVLDWGGVGEGRGTPGMASAIVTHLFEKPLGAGEMWGWLTSHSSEVRELPDFQSDSVLAAGGVMGYVPEIDGGVGLTPDGVGMVLLLAGVGSVGGLEGGGTGAV